jgi:hypothetical protein
VWGACILAEKKIQKKQEIESRRSAAAEIAGERLCG